MVSIERNGRIALDSDDKRIDSDLGAQREQCRVREQRGANLAPSGTSNGAPVVRYRPELATLYRLVERVRRAANLPDRGAIRRSGQPARAGRGLCLRVQ